MGLGVWGNYGIAVYIQDVLNSLGMNFDVIRAYNKHLESEGEGSAVITWSELLEATEKHNSSVYKKAKQIENGLLSDQDEDASAILGEHWHDVISSHIWVYRDESLLNYAIEQSNKDWPSCSIFDPSEEGPFDAGGGTAIVKQGNLSNDQLQVIFHSEELFNSVPTDRGRQFMEDLHIKGDTLEETFIAEWG